MATKQTKSDADVRVAISVHQRLKVLVAERRTKMGLLASKILKDYLDTVDRRKARKAGR